MKFLGHSPLHIAYGYFCIIGVSYLRTRLYDLQRVKYLLSSLLQKTSADPSITQKLPTDVLVSKFHSCTAGTSAQILLLLLRILAVREPVLFFPFSTCIGQAQPGRQRPPRTGNTGAGGAEQPRAGIRLAGDAQRLSQHHLSGQRH